MKIAMKNNKKGLTPIIAVILLLMMTVAAAGAAFFWFIRVQGELQGGGEQFTQELNEKLISTAEFLLGEINNGTNTDPGASNLTLLFKNTGAATIPLNTGSTPPTTSFLLQDQDQRIICNTDLSTSGQAECLSGCTDIPTSALQTVVLNLTSDCDISADANETLYFFKIDFSGVTAVGGQFSK